MDTRKPTQTPDRHSETAGLNLVDVYYVIFRHKWKIITLSALGFAVAAVVYLNAPTNYSSEAKLYISYVMESAPPNAGEPQVKTPDASGANIIHSEIEIIKSRDLAVTVAEAVGPGKILGDPSNTNKYYAANELRQGLRVEAVPNSDIVRIVFQNPNQDIVQPVLSQLIDAYKRKHTAIHGGHNDFDDVLNQEVEGAGSQLATIEQELRQSETNLGLMSFEESKKANNEELVKTHEAIMGLQTELSAVQAALDDRQKSLPAKADTANDKTQPEIPAAKLAEYKRIVSLLDSLHKKETELEQDFTPENAKVIANNNRISLMESNKAQMEVQFPKLAALQLSAQGPASDLSADTASIARLKAMLQGLNSKWVLLTNQAKALIDQEPLITKLQREKELQEAKYKDYQKSLAHERFQQALLAGKMSNISDAQAPSPPYRESQSVLKTVGLIAIGGVAAGLALAFLMEFFFDTSLRRPADIMTSLRLPLFLTIPRMSRLHQPALPAPSAPGTGPKEPDAAGLKPAANKTLEVAAWEPNGMTSYYEALRDRLITYFETNNLKHKPKLIAVTGCAKGAGVTTIATGLAASLSETGDGNVLLVDVTGTQGAAHPFFKGKPGCGLAEALTSETRNNALIRENLYAVTERGNAGALPRILPKRFNSLVPQLQASDYDYIIFDMPPVNQISVTPRLAGFMDMVMLVIESERTDRDTAKRAVAMLNSSKSNVSAVLNKHQHYIPEKLHREY